MKKLILLFMLLCCIPVINAIPLIDFDFTIYDDNTVILESFNTYDGTYERPLFGNPDYVMEIKDKEDNIVEQLELPVIFYHPDIGIINQVSILVKLPYNPDWKSMQIYHSGNLIFQKDIEDYFCNNNNICEKNENYVSCEKDCPSGIKDGWCDRKVDNICDPDCLEGIDKDCLKEEKTPTNWLFITVLLIIFIVLAGFFIHSILVHRR